MGDNRINTAANYQKGGVPCGVLKSGQVYQQKGTKRLYKLIHVEKYPLEFVEYDFF